jgi:hypothetical protein
MAKRPVVFDVSEDEDEDDLEVAKTQVPPSSYRA